MVGADADPVLNSKTAVKAEKPAAKVEPALETKAEEPAPASVDEGAAAAVKIAPKAEARPRSAAALDTKNDNPGSDEPCVETVDTKCSN